MKKLFVTMFYYPIVSMGYLWPVFFAWALVLFGLGVAFGYSIR